MSRPATADDVAALIAEVHARFNVLEAKLDLLLVKTETLVELQRRVTVVGS